MAPAKELFEYLKHVECFVINDLEIHDAFLVFFQLNTELVGILSTTYLWFPKDGSISELNSTISKIFIQSTQLRVSQFFFFKYSRICQAKSQAGREVECCSGRRQDGFGFTG